MIPVLHSPSRSLARALPGALPALMFSALAVAQEPSDPLGLGYESATESHRGFDDKPLAPDGRSTSAPPIPSAPAAPSVAAKPAGDRPAPVDPMAGASAREATPAAPERSPRVRALMHDSVLEDYTPFEPSDGPDWVGANDTVGEIGGWRTYARELFEAESATSEAVEPEVRAAEPAAANRLGETQDGTPAAPEPPQRARALAYDSVLEDYVPYEESDGPNWVEANRRVGEIGGWRAYARELFESSVTDGEAR